MKTRYISDAWHTSAQRQYAIEIKSLDEKVVLKADAGNLALTHFMEIEQALELIEALQEAILEAQMFQGPNTMGVEIESKFPAEAV